MQRGAAAELEFEFEFEFEFEGRERSWEFLSSSGKRDDVSGDRPVAVFVAGDDSREHEGRGGSPGVQSARVGGHLHREQHEASFERARADG